MDLARWRVGPAGKPFPYLAVGTGGLVLTAAVSWGNLLLLVMGQVIPTWVLDTALLLVSLLLMGAHVVRRRRLTADRGAPEGPSTPRHFGYVVVIVLAVACTAFRAVGDLGAQYFVLRPTGPHGCTAVVRETAFLLAGNGEVFGVRGSTGIAWGPSASWYVDDGYRPVAAGSYTLRWDRTDGSLAVSGTAGNPVFSGVNTVDCG